MLVNKNLIKCTFFFYCVLQSIVVVYQSLQRPVGWVCTGSAYYACLRCCPALCYHEPCWSMLCCATLYSFLPRCAVPIWTSEWAMADRGLCGLTDALGQSCWAGPLLTGGLGWMDPCSRASCGGGPKSRLEPVSETVMRAAMCQEWQNSTTTRYPHQPSVFLIWLRLFFLPLTKIIELHISSLKCSCLVLPTPFSIFLPSLSPLLTFFATY